MFAGLKLEQRGTSCLPMRTFLAHSIGSRCCFLPVPALIYLFPWYLISRLLSFLRLRRASFRPRGTLSSNPSGWGGGGVFGARMQRLLVPSGVRLHHLAVRALLRVSERAPDSSRAVSTCCVAPFSSFPPPLTPDLAMASLFGGTLRLHPS